MTTRGANLTVTLGGLRNLIRVECSIGPISHGRYESLQPRTRKELGNVSRH